MQSVECGDGVCVCVCVCVNPSDRTRALACVCVCVCWVRSLDVIQAWMRGFHIVDMDTYFGYGLVLGLARLG